MLKNNEVQVFGCCIVQHFCYCAGGGGALKSTEIFPIITEKLQRQFEKKCKETRDQTPDICGYYGRACRCLESEEGANRALC